MEQIESNGQNDKSETFFVRTLSEILAGEPYIMVNCKLHTLTKNIETTIIMSYLEGEFYKNPNGFYMFYAPCPEQPNYQKGNSWSEVINLKINDLKLNFDRIGVRYGSYREFAEAKNKFQNKYYCSYYDKTNKQVYYMRNNDVIERDIKSATTV